MNIKIRFNTEKDKRDASLSPWRVIIDGVEHLAESVVIETTAWTTYDEIQPGLFKWHVSCVGQANWDELKKACTIKGA